MLMPALPEDSDFTGVHSEHRPEYMHTLSFLILYNDIVDVWMYNNISLKISTTSHLLLHVFAQARPTMPCIALVMVHRLCGWQGQGTSYSVFVMAWWMPTC